MADAFIVKINQALLRQRFTQTDGHEWTDAEVANWLHECGFRYRGEQHWLCEELTLDALARDEYAIVRPA